MLLTFLAAVSAVVKQVKSGLVTADLSGSDAMHRHIDLSQ